ncbi:hypothetical protein LTR17_011738 [Elasticomyces elasticus]|nr:hypothetical protein LTR17_011738 [Elasticomyces elasticus]
MSRSIGGNQPGAYPPSSASSTSSSATLTGPQSTRDEFHVDSDLMDSLSIDSPQHQIFTPATTTPSSPAASMRDGYIHAPAYAESSTAGRSPHHHDNSEAPVTGGYENVKTRMNDVVETHRRLREVTTEFERKQMETIAKLDEQTASLQALKMEASLLDVVGVAATSRAPLLHEEIAVPESDNKTQPQHAARDETGLLEQRVQALEAALRERTDRAEWRECFFALARLHHQVVFFTRMSHSLARGHISTYVLMAQVHETKTRVCEARLKANVMPTFEELSVFEGELGSWLHDDGKADGRDNGDMSRAILGVMKKFEPTAKDFMEQAREELMQQGYFLRPGRG